MTSNVTAAHQKPIAALRIEVLGCKDLYVHGRYEISDPYVIVKYAGERRQTNTVKDNVNPVFNAKASTWDFPIYANALENAKSKIEFFVWDKDVTNDDDYLGQSTIASGKWFEHSGDKSFTSAKNKSFWIPLGSAQSNVVKAQGQIHLKVGFVDAQGSHGTDFEQVWKQLFPVKGTHGVLRIQVIEAKELYASEGGKSDPYVTIKFAGINDRKTETVWKTLKPVYNAATSTLDFPFDANSIKRAGQNVEIIVWDEDVKNADDRLGEITLPVTDLLESGGDRDFKAADNKSFWLALGTSRPTRKPKGQVHLKVGFVDTDIRRVWGELFEKPTVTLRVHVLGCRLLADADEGRHGKSDSYVDVEFLGERHATPIRPNNLNPQWDANSASFDFPIFESAIARIHSGAEVLKFVVFDKDPGNKSEYLGELTLPVSEWFKHTGEKGFESAGNKDFFVPLVSTHFNRQAEGKINLKLGFVDPAHKSSTDFNKLYDQHFGKPIVKPTPPLPPPSTLVTFQFAGHAQTKWGDQIYVVGNIPALGSWDPEKAIQLSSASYPTWSKEVKLPPKQRFEYKYIRKTPGQAVVWEDMPFTNRTAQTPASGSVSVHDSWY